jgi:homoserine O-acetyltransferase
MPEGNMTAQIVTEDIPHPPDEASVGIVERKYFTFAEPPNEMVLESGVKFGPITLAYETYGTLNADASNAILLCHALSGDAHVAGKHRVEDRKPGWWDSMVGPGKAFDTDKYFVVCSNVLGGCMGSTGPSSINPATGKPYGLDFPIITIGDMVRAQRELVLHLGIERLLCVAGGSMGGMQALEWSVRFPEAVRSAMVIAATHVSGAQQIAFDAVGRNAIMGDPAFKGGQYYDGELPAKGLSIARMLAHITYLSDTSMRAKFGRNLRRRENYSYEFESEFAVETYLDYQGEQFVARFDANTYLYITKAMDYFNVAERFSSLDAAMARVKARMLVLSFSSDWLYPPYQSEQIVYALARQGKDVTYCNIRSDYGHDAFLLETDVMTRIVKGFLNHTENPNVILDDPAQAEVQPVIHGNIFEGHRYDYDLITDLVAEGSRVLDIGCGHGELFAQINLRKRISGCGMELAQDNVVACAQRGVSVIQADIDKGLKELPDKCFDYILLSMTLQVLKRPEAVLKEMLRVGRRCIVSFPNFGHWQVRLKALVSGRAPVTKNLPYSWYDSPNRHVLSIKDFREFCEKLNIRIEREIPLTKNGYSIFLPNLFADEAVYVISSGDR